MLDLLLQRQHDKATLDSATTRKQFTPLFCAIKFGDPDVMERLLHMGTSADRRANIVDETPLHYTVTILGFVKRPGRLYHYLQQSMLADPDELTREVLRRYNVNFTSVYGDGQAVRNMMESPEHSKLVDKVILAMVEEQIGHHSISKLVRIIELLLMRKANPNASHNVPTAPGRTPLMLAAENDSAQVFDLMMKHGGNPYQPDAAGMDCTKIAMGFHAGEVVKYLRTKGYM